MRNYFITLTLLLTAWAFPTPPKAAAKEQVSPITQLLAPYMEIQKALSQDKLDLLPSLSHSMQDDLKKVSKETLEQTEQALIRQLSVEIESFKKVSDPKLYRTRFGNISRLYVDYLKSHPKEAKNLQLFFCPMFPQGYAFWVQRQGEPLANPYWGHEMLECGVKRPWK